MNLHIWCRKIWGCLCFDSCTYHCSSLLPFLCLCWYVLYGSGHNWSSFSFQVSIPKSDIHFLVNQWAGSAGLGFLQFCNLNSMKTKFILGFSVFMGLSIPQYFNEYTTINGYGPVHTGARWVSNYSLLLLTWSPTKADHEFFCHGSFAVQWYDQCPVLVRSLCSWPAGIVPWCHASPQKGQRG